MEIKQIEVLTETGTPFWKRTYLDGFLTFLGLIGCLAIFYAVSNDYYISNYFLFINDCYDRNYRRGDKE